MTTDIRVYSLTSSFFVNLVVKGNRLVLKCELIMLVCSIVWTKWGFKGLKCKQHTHV